MSLSPTTIPAVRNLSLNAANCPDGIYCAATSAQAQIYAELVAADLVEEFDCFHPAVKCYRTTALGKLHSDSLHPTPVVEPAAFVTQPGLELPTRYVN